MSELETVWLDAKEAAALAGREHARQGIVLASKDPISGWWRFDRADLLRVYGLGPRRALAVDAGDLIRSEWRRMRGEGRGKKRGA